MTFIPLMIQRALSLPHLRSGKVYTLNNFRALSNIRTPTCHRCQKTSITWPLMIVLHLVLQIDGIRIPSIILMMAAPHGLMKWYTRRTPRQFSQVTENFDRLVFNPIKVTTQMT